tara:strand:- start:771 stop:992 length:222 start_codon:yes stop_codon:yes gene_type:complete
MDAIRPTISAICRFPNFEGSPGGLDGGKKSMKSNRGMPYDIFAIRARDYDAPIIEANVLYEISCSVPSSSLNG